MKSSHWMAATQLVILLVLLAGCARKRDCEVALKSLDESAEKVKKVTGDDPASINALAAAMDIAVTEISAINVSTPEVKGYLAEFQNICRDYATSGREAAAILIRREAVDARGKENKDRQEKAVAKLEAARDEILGVCKVARPPADCSKIVEGQEATTSLKALRDIPPVELQAEAFAGVAATMKSANVTHPELKKDVDDFVEKLGELSQVARDVVKGMTEWLELSNRLDAESEKRRTLVLREDALLLKVGEFCGR